MQNLDWLSDAHHGIVQITTPYSSGTGFMINGLDCIITNEHVIRDNKRVVIEGHNMERQTVEVLFFDELYDLAFLSPPIFKSTITLRAKLAQGDEANLGDPVYAIGHPLGLKFSTTKGIISSFQLEFSGINYIQHDAALNPGNSGGPLYNQGGEIIGINTFMHKNGSNIGIALPVNHLQNIIEQYTVHYPNKAIKCASCNFINTQFKKQNNYCTNCGSGYTAFEEIEEYLAVGIAKKIEDIILAMGYDADLCRRGSSQWEIRKGSAMVQITYHEKSGYLIAEAVLCYLNMDNMVDIYTYLLKQNYYNKEMSFSIKDNSIILSTIIYDQHFRIETGKKIFQRLIDNSDKYDNILVEQFGAKGV
jgi:serine protease Do